MNAFESAPGDRQVLTTALDDQLQQCHEPGCRRWVVDTPVGRAAHRCGESSRLARLRMDLFEEELSRVRPLDVPADDRHEVFRSLVSAAFTRQAELLGRAAALEPDGAGSAVATAWRHGRDLLVTPRSTPVVERSLRLAAPRPTLRASHSSSLVTRVLLGWRAAVLHGAPRFRVARARPSVTDAAVLNSTELLVRAAEVEVPHWWTRHECHCRPGHAWLAPLLGWLEVLVEAAP
jgi:hypothetical protein